MASNPTTPHTKIWQTSDFILCSVLIFSLALESIVATSFSSLYSTAAGLFFWLLGLVVIILAKWTFRKKQQSTGIGNTPSQLIVTGIFSYSRHPIYLGMVCITIGLALILDSVWTLLGVPVFVGLLQYVLILPEEKFLTEKFGEEFVRYQDRVRRWL